METRNQRTDSVSVDVAVIGAGLSGLVAARRLAQQGLTVCVLEARDLGSGTGGCLPAEHAGVDQCYR